MTTDLLTERWDLLTKGVADTAAWIPIPPRITASGIPMQTISLVQLDAARAVIRALNQDQALWIIAPAHIPIIRRAMAQATARAWWRGLSRKDRRYLLRRGVPHV